MKYIYTFLLVIAISFSFLRAQVPNAGFENWVNSDPVGWSTYDNLGDAVTQTSDSHSGSSAAKMQIIDFFGSPLPAILISGQFAVSEKFGSLTGYFKFTPIDANQLLSVVIYMSKGINFIGAGVFETSQTASSYIQFVVPIQYSSGEIPDSAYIQIAVSDSSGTSTGGIGAYAVVDDLGLGGPTSVNDIIATINSFKLYQNYPNPFNPSTSIQYQVFSVSPIDLKVYDVLGNLVATLVNEEKPAGSYEVTFDASSLTSGVYFYKISAGNFVETKKMILLR